MGDTAITVLVVDGRRVSRVRVEPTDRPAVPVPTDHPA